MVRRHRSGKSLRELRDEAAAAEALGLTPKPERRPPAERSSEPRSRPIAAPKQRLVWGVFDTGGRSVATFPYAQKADAEARAKQLEERGKGKHYVRSVKESMTPGD